MVLPVEESSDELVLKKEKVDTLDGFFVRDVELDWLPIKKGLLDGIVKGKGVGDKSAYLLKAVTALYSAGCDKIDILSILTDPKYFMGEVAYKHAETKSRKKAAEWLWKYTVAKVFDERDPTKVFGDAEEEEKLSPEKAKAQSEEVLSQIHWSESLDLNQHKQVKSSLKNLDLIFSNSSPENIFIRDMFANKLIYGIDSPWGRLKDQSLEDIDMILIKRWLSEKYKVEPNQNAILEATTLLGYRKRIHPVREWLTSLKWDGKPRLGTWIKDYCEGQAEELT